MHDYVAVVCILVEQNLAPVSSGSSGCVTVAVGVGMREAGRIQTRSDRIIVDRGQDHRKTRRADDLHCATNAIDDLQRPIVSANVQNVVVVLVRFADGKARSGS